MTEEDHEAKEPVNYVRLSESTKQLIVDDCVLCGETHRHGSMDAEVARGGRSHRGAHCRGETAGGYYLELHDDAEPPRVWFERVGVKPPEQREGDEA